MAVESPGALIKSDQGKTWRDISRVLHKFGICMCNETMIPWIWSELYLLG